MKSLGEVNYHSLGQYGLMSVVAILAFNSLTVVLLPQVVNSFAQMSAVTSTPVNHTSPPLKKSSEKLSPPLITLIAPTDVAPQGPLEQQNSLYENPHLGFAIQYPSNWKVAEGNLSKTVVVVAFSSPLESNFDTFAENFAIGVQQLPAGTTVDEYGQSAVEVLQSRPDFKLIESPVSLTFGGLPAQKIEFNMMLPSERAIATNTTEIQGIQVWTIKDDAAYVVSFAASTE